MKCGAVVQFISWKLMCHIKLIIILIFLIFLLWTSYQLSAAAFQKVIKILDIYLFICNGLFSFDDSSSGSDTSDSITSDSNSDSSSTSSSEIEAIHKTEGVRKCPILKHKVKRKVNYRAL